MLCPCCGFDNIPGADWCDECGISLTQEDIPLSYIKGRVAECLSEDTVDVLDVVQRPHLREDTTLHCALDLMQIEKCCSLLVVNEDGKLSGILTVRDFLAKVLRKEISLTRTTVAEVMTVSPETLRLEHKLAYAVQCMLVGDYRHVPLTDDAGRPVGLISTRQLIQHLTDISGVCT